MQVVSNSPFPKLRKKVHSSAANQLTEYKTTGHEVYQSELVNCTPWIVQPGQTVESLVAALKVLPGEIRDLNQVSKVVAGQLIYLPVHNVKAR